jgi:hypothetical protein
MANRPVRIVGAILATLLVVAMLAGIGVMAYNAGVAQGLVTSGQVVAPETGAQAVPYARHFLWAPFGFGWGFGILRALFGLFIGLLVFGLIVRLLVGGLFGWRRWGRFGGGPGRWHEGGVPPMFEEWHRRAHGEEQAPKHEDKPQG